METTTTAITSGGCKSGAADDGGLVDVEDIGVVMGKAKDSNNTVCQYIDFKVQVKGGLGPLLLNLPNSSENTYRIHPF